MKIATPDQMKSIDALAIEDYGIPGILLMENAANKVVTHIARLLGGVLHKKIILFAGKGNNGGDACAVARHLFNLGAQVNVFLLCNKEELKGDAITNLSIISKMGVEIDELIEVSLYEKVNTLLKNCDLIVDGIFGTGFKGKVEGIAKDIINLINSVNKTVLAIDIPSGVNGYTGNIDSTSIKATCTVTFQLPKLGLLLYPGCEAVGDLIIEDIGIPKAITDNIQTKLSMIDEETVKRILPKRTAQSNKGNYGKALIVTGSTGMTGSGCLATKACLRSGAGLVYTAVPKSLSGIYNCNILEAITLPLDDLNEGRVCTGAAYAVKKYMSNMTTVAIGPGMGQHADTVKAISEMISNAEIPLVLDADALNTVSRDLNILASIKKPVVITPHPGEMARLCGRSVEEVQNNRIEIALEFSAKWKVITVLKGNRTIIALPSGEIFINATGNAGMATGGTGDVLTGMITGFAAQGLALKEASIIAVYLHGLAGDMVVEQKGMYGLIAGDIVEMIPYTIKRFEEAMDGLLLK